MPPWARPLTSLVALFGFGCGASRAPEPRAPVFEPDSQTKCGVVKSSSRPLIVEWPASDRAQLEAAARGGIIAVRYQGCDMEVLARCKLPGSYRYTPTTRKLERVSIRDADELYAELPVGAAKLEGKLEQSGELEVAMHVVGRYDAAPEEQRGLTGACSGATHVITGLTAGAFEFSSAAGSRAGGGAAVMGMGAGATSEKSKSLISRDGQPEACAGSSTDDERPPEGCAALLRVEVTPVADLAITHTPPAGTDAPAASEPQGGLGVAGAARPEVKSGPGVVRVFINSPRPLELHGVGVARLEPVPGGFRSLGPSTLLCRGSCEQYLDLRVGQHLVVGSSEIPFSAPIQMYDREGDVQLDVEPGNGTSLGLGVTSLSLGVVAAVTGLSLAGTGLIINSADSAGGSGDGLTKWGLITLGGGAALIGLGIVLVSDGSTKVEVRAPTAAR